MAYACQVLVVRREDETVNHEYLSLTGTQSKPSGLPSAKILDELPDEAPEEAAARALSKVGLVTWPAAMELLYLGADFRGRLVHTYLCRGYNTGKVNSKTETVWKRMPTARYTDHGIEYAMGLDLALVTRQKLQDASRVETPLSVKMAKPAAMYVDATLVAMRRDTVDLEDAETTRGLYHALSRDEKAVAGIIEVSERRRLGKALIVSNPPRSEQFEKLRDYLVEGAVDKPNEKSDEATDADTNDVEASFE